MKYQHLSRIVCYQNNVIIPLTRLNTSHDNNHMTLVEHDASSRVNKTTPSTPCITTKTEMSPTSTETHGHEQNDITGDIHTRTIPITPITRDDYNTISC